MAFPLACRYAQESSLWWLDATNSTRSRRWATDKFIFISPWALERRGRIEARIAKEKGIQLIFLESLCDDPTIIAANVALKVSSGDPDYMNTSPDQAKADFLKRIREYEKIYETITEPHLSYLKIVNVGSQVEVSRIHGYLQSRIAYFLTNLHLKPRSIYLSRVGFRLNPFDVCADDNVAATAWGKSI
jgi:6-phosphofructo-2-kinase/fructose-2,6-biphosphatase 2